MCEILHKMSCSWNEVEYVGGSFIWFYINLKSCHIYNYRFIIINDRMGNFILLNIFEILKNMGDKYTGIHI